MKSVLVAAISAALLAIALHVLAQESITSPRPDVIARAESPDPAIGKWTGDWQCSERCRNYGSMEMEIDVNGDQVTGRVRSTSEPYKSDCSIEWEKVAGVRKGAQIFAQYNYGGRCGIVDLIYSIDADGRIMTGRWSSQWPSNGTFRLQKTATAGLAQ